MKKVFVKLIIAFAISLLVFEASGHIFSEKQYYVEGVRSYPNHYRLKSYYPFKLKIVNERYWINAFNYKYAYTSGFSSFGILLLIFMIPELRRK